ncbi:MAG: hypothetical protein ACRC8S_15720 [Fimbriiglobus sp.]
MRAVVASLALLAVVGCFSPRPEKVWMDQYEGLRQIPDMNTRVNMLTGIMRSAAYSGDAAAVKRFLKDFRGDPRHDELAAECARYIKETKLEDAEMIANLIEDEQRRAYTLSELKPKPKDDDTKPDEKAVKPSKP